MIICPFQKMRSLIVLLGLVAVCHCVSLLDVAKEEWKLFKVSSIIQRLEIPASSQTKSYLTNPFL